MVCVCVRVCVRVRVRGVRVYCVWCVYHVVHMYTGPSAVEHTC